MGIAPRAIGQCAMMANVVQQTAHTAGSIPKGFSCTLFSTLQIAAIRVLYIRFIS